MSSIKEGILVGVGNPLLDITVTTNNTLLKKYGLEPNNAIIAEESHLPLYEEITRDFTPEYTAGGSAQNTLRVAQWLLRVKNACIYMGSVGEDKFSDILKAKASDDGVLVRYQYQKTIPTGTCAVIVTHDNGSHRSLCANLGAANHFTKSHIEVPENVKIIENADYIYIGGFFLTVSPETIMALAEIAHTKKKTLMTNLSAQFICQFFTDRLMDMMPYVDVIFGNETEAAALSTALKFNTDDIEEIAMKIYELPKKNEALPRMVVITQGHLPVILVKDGKISKIEVPALAKEKIVDTNGAGDAFVGGFLSQFIQKLDVVDCVKCGIWTASQIIQHSGCTFDPSLSYRP